MGEHHSSKRHCLDLCFDDGGVEHCLTWGLIGLRYSDDIGLMSMKMMWFSRELFGIKDLEDSWLSEARAIFVAC